MEYYTACLDSKSNDKCIHGQIKHVVLDFSTFNLIKR